MTNARKMTMAACLAVIFHIRSTLPSALLLLILLRVHILINIFTRYMSYNTV